jgi:hypothetical protein
MKYYCFAIFLIINFLNSISYAAPNKPIVCTQEYALCTSAPCIPDPRHSDYAICSCIIENGKSVGYKSCKQRMPKQDQFKAKQVISTFSFEQFKTKKSMACAKGMPWTDCVDAPCTVNPRDPAKAICSCKISHDQAYFTFGGGCETKTCATGFWSGATESAGTLLRNALLEVTREQSQSIANSCAAINKTP